MNLLKQKSWAVVIIDENEDSKEIKIINLLKENNYVAKLFDSLTFDNKEIEDFYKKIFMVLNNYIDKRIGVYNA